jgi:type II secretory pathway pseudopilin PulG
MGKGFIDPDKGLSMMDMGGVEKLYDEVKADERQAGRENLRMRALDVDAIMEHMQQHEQSMYAAQAQQAMLAQQQQMQMQQQEQGTVQNVLPGLPPEVGDPNNAAQALQGLDQLSQSLSGPPVDENGQEVQPTQQQEPQAVPSDAGFGQDTQTQQPLVIPPNMVSVNTWDNHQVHIEIHNRFRKNQVFEILPEPVKQQFEAHVNAHATALNQAAMAAAMMMPPGQAPPGANNGAGTPIGPSGPPGSNQFGPPGTSQGGEMPPPPMPGG